MSSVEGGIIGFDWDSIALAMMVARFIIILHIAISEGSSGSLLCGHSAGDVV